MDSTSRKRRASEQRDEQQHQINLPSMSSPDRALWSGRSRVEGDAGYSIEQIEEIAKLHPGDPVLSSRITRALQRIRARYQKQDRLLAQV